MRFFLEVHSLVKREGLRGIDRAHRQDDSIGRKLLEEKIRAEVLGRHRSWKEVVHPAILDALQQAKPVAYSDTLPDLLLAIKNSYKLVMRDETVRRDIALDSHLENSPLEGIPWEVEGCGWVGHYFQRKFPKLFLTVCHVTKASPSSCDWFSTHPDFVGVQRYFERECFEVKTLD